MLWFKRIAVVIVTFLVAGYAVLFTLRNGSKTDLDLLVVQFVDAPLDLVVLASFVCGGILGVLSSLGLLWAQRQKYRKALLKAERAAL